MRVVTEPAGRLLGALLAPLAAAVSALRRARTFHPEGTVLHAEVSPLAAAGRERLVAERLAGPALVRLSTAWWRGGKEWRDVLGCAIRFHEQLAPSAVPAPGDQDLLFATIRSPWTTLLASLTTQLHDYLANDFYAVSPFETEGLGKVKWRLVSSRPVTEGGSREQRLRFALHHGAATFQLECRSLGLRRAWRPIARVRLVEELELDQAALRFSPFRSGRGIRPIGLVHALRRATYPSSQRARPAHG